MKNVRKILLVVIIALLLVCVSCNNTDDNKEVEDLNAQIEGYKNEIENLKAELEETNNNNNASLDKIKELEKEIEKLEKKLALFDDLTECTIYYTNDVHSYVTGSTFTYAYLKTLKDSTENSLLVDAGDEIQGNIYGTFDKGESIIKLMNATGYDLATLGNHEFDYGIPELEKRISEAKFDYVSCNFVTTKSGKKENVLKPYKTFEVNGLKIAFIGISTPYTVTSSTPKYFMNENNEFIYDFDGRENVNDLYASVQESINEAKKEADVIIALGHIGEEGDFTSENIIKNVSGLNAFIDGHSHSKTPKNVLKDKDGKDVVVSQTGNYFSSIGKMTITFGKEIDTELIELREELDEDATVKEINDKLIEDVTAAFSAKVADLDNNLYINDPDTSTRMVRKAETNLSDFVTDAYYWYVNYVDVVGCDIAISNGGGIRSDVMKGDLLLQNCKSISPFGNDICVKDVKGSAILDALEFGARATPQETGGFLQVAGLSYKIDDSIASSIQVESNLYKGSPTGEYRVYDVKVYDKDKKAYVDLDLEKTYRVCGIAYILDNMGDGFTMFSGSKMIKSSIGVDFTFLAEYAKVFTDTDGNNYPNINTANSPLKELEGYLMNYEEKNGSGRIIYAKKNN